MVKIIAFGAVVAATAMLLMMAFIVLLFNLTWVALILMFLGLLAYHVSDAGKQSWSRTWYKIRLFIYKRL